MYSSFISIVALILKQLVHCRVAFRDRQNVRKSSKNNIDQVCLLMRSLRTPSNIIYTDKYKRNIVLDFRGSSSHYCDDIISYQPYGQKWPHSSGNYSVVNWVIQYQLSQRWIINILLSYSGDYWGEKENPQFKLLVPLGPEWFCLTCEIGSGILRTIMH